MPKSKVRKKTAYTPPQPDKRTPAMVRASSPSSPIYIGVMLGLMVLGLVWLVVNYLAGSHDPVHGRARPVELRDRVPAHRVGLLMTMRWR